jgi:hypothetical protein
MSENILNQLVVKLLQRPEKKNSLIFNSEASKRTYRIIKSRIKNNSIDENSFLVVSTFLQNTDTSIFSDEELQTLLMFDYSSITASKVLPDKLKVPYTKPIFDLGNKIVNMDYLTITNISSEFLKIHSINKSLSLEFLVSYITNQL